ncbi:GRP family sugar transporter [Staphylococcus aureus]
MSIVALLIGLGPLIGWGFFPTVASKFGGKPVHQIIGATVHRNLRYYISRSHIKWLPYWNQFAIRLIIRCRIGDSDKSLHLKRSN